MAGTTVAEVAARWR